MMEHVENELEREQMKAQLEILLTYCEEREYLQNYVKESVEKLHSILN